MSDDVKALIAEARQREFYWGRYSEESGSRGLMLSKYELGVMAAFAGRVAAALEAATVAPAVDREALVKLLQSEGVVGGNVVASEIIASGILRDVRDVQAEGADLAADWLAQQLWPDAADYAGHVRQFAQAIREARSER